MKNGFLENRPLAYLQGVGPRKAELLKKELGIASCQEMLYFFPYKHIDRTRFYSINELSCELPHVQIRGRILRFDIIGAGRQRRLVAKFADHTGIVDLVWFQGLQYVIHKYKLNTDYILFGKPHEFNHLISIPHPELDTPQQAALFAGHLVPFYHTSETMKKAFLHSRAIQDIQRTLTLSIKDVPEILPSYLIDTHHLIALGQALRYIHFPPSVQALEQARLRLKFDELFFIQLNILRSASLRKQKIRGVVCPRVGNYFNTFYHNYLPFPLTDAQKRVVREIRADLSSGRQMNRLVQGDVGCGKTLVALLSILLALDNGHQACIMAPTEILAAQHFETFSDLLKPLSLHIALLTGATTQHRRKHLLSNTASGKINILIGTHALLEEKVVFASLALAIIDEQHRFGVVQRARLQHKDDFSPPHILVMTATPIPRTLALTLYGDLDVSIIDQLPPGRKPVKTIHRYDNRKDELFAFLRSQIEQGRQAYIVFPLIEDSDNCDFKNLEEAFKLYCDIFPDLSIRMLHGKMKVPQKQDVMHNFIEQRIHILMATTVIEVGVNVPNASVMVIESAERFGLAQLHQLRGRVGRGAEQAYCVLVTTNKLSDDARRRIDIMVNTNDGFQIAEEDLRLRGHGDLDGTQQSGLYVDLRIANLTSDGALLQEARHTAQAILSKDPNLSLPENATLAQHLRTLCAHKEEWHLIS
jgi:ATP-dependent DNA helicase RecG